MVHIIGDNLNPAAYFGFRAAAEQPNTISRVGHRALGIGMIAVGTCIVATRVTVVIFKLERLIHMINSITIPAVTHLANPLGIPLTVDSFSNSLPLRVAANSFSSMAAAGFMGQVIRLLVEGAMDNNNGRALAEEVNRPRVFALAAVIGGTLEIGRFVTSR